MQKLSEYWIEKKKEFNGGDPLAKQKWRLRCNIKQQMDVGNVSATCFFSKGYKKEELQALVDYIKKEEGLLAEIKYDCQQKLSYIYILWDK